MNKRELKKSVNYICSELFAEGVAASLYSEQHQRVAGIYYQHTERLCKENFAPRARHACKGVLQTADKGFQQHRFGSY